MLITAFLFYFVFVQSIEGAVELSISGNLLRVKSSSGEWYPLCSNSVNQKYGNIACSTQSNQQLSSYSFVLLNQTTYSIACTSNLCFSFLSSYCKTGVLVNCIPKNNLCSDTSVQIGKKCVRVSRVLVDGYFDAQEACNPSSLIGNIKPNDIQQISNSFGNNTVLITSGVRRGSKWQWGSGDKIEIPIIGNDRCLAIIENKLQSIDCEAKGFAMCEMGRECISSGNEYSGELAKASNGKKCLKWNDPSILFGQKISNLWSHNYCRFVNQNGTQSRKPMCYTSYQNIDECSIPQCPEQFNDPLNNNKKCSWDMFSCDNNTKCISNKFKCDYDIDCNDGTDELDCEDYLQPFELIGAYRLADNIIEVWTYIPHVQGCARKCQESLLICEAFSYEPKTQTCLLSDTSHSYTSLVQKITSLYYRRRFSSKDVEFQLINNTLIATKQTIRAPVCDENFSSDKIGSICRVLGFG